MNKRYPLTISTYDGSGQVVHPSVIKVSGMGDYGYLMAMTPYPGGYDRKENPSLRISPDGVQWSTPVSVADPLVSEPCNNNEHYSDPQIYFYNEKYYLFYRHTDKLKDESTIYFLTSSNLVEWSEAESVLTGRAVLSPSFLYFNGRWHCYYVDMWKEGIATLTQLMSVSADALSELTSVDPSKVEVPLPLHQNIWHMEVKFLDGQLYLLSSVFSNGKPFDQQQLNIYVSEHSGNWLQTGRPIKQSRFGWDARLMYKASIEKADSGYTVWYSACSYNYKWRVARISLDAAFREVLSSDVSIKQDFIFIIDNAIGYAKANIKRLVPRFVINIVKTVLAKIR